MIGADLLKLSYKHVLGISFGILCRCQETSLQQSYRRTDTSRAVDKIEYKKSLLETRPTLTSLRMMSSNVVFFLGFKA